MYNACLCIYSVFCYCTSNLHLSLLIPLSPRLQSWKFGSWLLATQHQSHEAAVGAAGLLTLGHLLRSSISQPLLDSNETCGKGSGRGFFLSKTKPEKFKHFRGGKASPLEWPCVSCPRCWTTGWPELCWDYWALGCDIQHASCSLMGGEKKQTSILTNSGSSFLFPLVSTCSHSAAGHFFDIYNSSCFTETAHSKAHNSRGKGL